MWEAAELMGYSGWQAAAAAAALLLPPLWLSSGSMPTTAREPEEQKSSSAAAKKSLRRVWEVSGYRLVDSSLCWFKKQPESGWFSQPAKSQKSRMEPMPGDAVTTPQKIRLYHEKTVEMELYKN